MAFIFVSQIICDVLKLWVKVLECLPFIAEPYLFFSASFISRLFPIWFSVTYRQQQKQSYRFFPRDQKRQYIHVTPSLYKIHFLDDFVAPWVSSKMNTFILYALLFFLSNLENAIGSRCRWDCMMREEEKERDGTTFMFDRYGRFISIIRSKIYVGCILWKLAFHFQWLWRTLFSS